MNTGRHSALTLSLLLATAVLAQEKPAAPAGAPATRVVPEKDGGFTSKVKVKLTAEGKFEASQVEVQKD